MNPLRRSRLTCLGARMPQARVNSFILDVRMLTPISSLSMICSICKTVRSAHEDAALVGRAGQGLLRVMVGHGYVAFVGRGHSLWAWEAERRGA